MSGLCLQFQRVKKDAEKRLFERLLLEAEESLKPAGIAPMWDIKELQFTNLVGEAGEAFIGYLESVPAATVIGFEEDLEIWPDKVGVDRAYYLHKITVRAQFRGKGFAHQVLAFMEGRARRKNCAYLRLDCRYHRQKLRELYTSFGLRIVDKWTMPFDELARLEMKLL